MNRKYLLLLIAFILSHQFLFAQYTLTIEDVLPKIGDKWFFGNASKIDNPFIVDLGAPGENAIYDFTGYAAVKDLETSITLTELTSSNASHLIEVIAPSSVENIPDVFSEADFFLKLWERDENIEWLAAYQQTEDGLIALGEMFLNTTTTPPTWSYINGFSYGPGRNILTDISLGETKSLTRTILTDTWSGGEDSIVVTDRYTFDGVGHFTSPQEEEHPNIFRLIHEMTVLIYSRFLGEWVLDFEIADKFIEYRKKGCLIPLVEVTVHEDWTTEDRENSSANINADFFFPDFLISSLEEKAISPPFVKVSPNPTKDIVQLHWGNYSGQDIQIQWFDIQGKLLNTSVWLNPQEGAVKQERVPDQAGIYFLKLIASEGIFTQKIVVK